MFKNYKKYIVKGKKQKYYAKSNFSWEKMKEFINTKLDVNVPQFAQQVELKLPELNLPNLKKVK